MKLTPTMKSVKNMKIGVLMGGFGKERVFSLKSGQKIFDCLIENHYNAIKIDPTEDLLAILQFEKPDVILNLLHGPFGEDGTVQAILEYLRIPFVSETPLSSGLAMDKLRTKEVLANYGIRTAKFYPFYHYLPHTFPSALELYDAIIEADVGVPFFLKDTAGGTSIGVWRIKNADDLTQILLSSNIKQHPSRYFAEKGIDGREISVGVYSNMKGIHILPIVEIEPEEGFFNIDAKLSSDTLETIPAKLSEEVISQIHSIIKKIYIIMQFRGCVRMDFILDKTADLEPVLLEINNQPGMTGLSLIPKMLIEQGIPLIEFLVEQINLISTYQKPNFY